MIRNWVGQTGDEAFYDACDKYGIVVWQDFWLANPSDGPDPDDNAMFLRNAEDYVAADPQSCFGRAVLRAERGLSAEADRRRAAADDGGVAPRPALYSELRRTMWSAGMGRTARMPLKFYFDDRATPKMHSELGMPNVVDHRQPEDDDAGSGAVAAGRRMWGTARFHADGRAGRRVVPQHHREELRRRENAAEWVTLAQFVNYDGYRAMFEAQSKNRMGLLIWMSHPAWPSFVWQTYDYYFEPTAAYFGSEERRPSRCTSSGTRRPTTSRWSITAAAMTPA